MVPLLVACGSSAEPSAAEPTEPEPSNDSGSLAEAQDEAESPDEQCAALVEKADVLAGEVLEGERVEPRFKAMSRLHDEADMVCDRRTARALSLATYEWSVASAYEHIGTHPNRVARFTAKGVAEVDAAVSTLN